MLSTVRHVRRADEPAIAQLARARQESVRPVNLARLAERVAQAKGDERTNLSVHAPDPVIIGHELKLERVVGHLMQNAIDATTRAARCAYE